jgi:hypothetical protein
VAEAVPVLFVAGTGRTGSTLVGNILASTPGVVSVGEVRHIWTRGLTQNWFCGCGEKFDVCQFWTTVLREAFGHPHRLDLARLQASDRELLRLRTGLRALGWVDHPARIRGKHGYYLNAIALLYAAIAKVADADAIVDSSKTPTYGAVLAVLESIDLRVLHLVRDPRAAAYSWRNPKASPDRGPDAEMDRIGLAKSAFLWTWWNGVSDGLWTARPDVPIVRVRYETVTRIPESTLRSIRDTLLPELAGRPLDLSGDTARLDVAHTVSGNPERMNTGQVVIRQDERWRTGLAKRHQAVVVLIAGPGMLKYGYGRKRW